MAKKANGSHFVIYPYYRHTGQDPMVRKVLDAVASTTTDSRHKTAKRAKVSPGTIKNWENKKTRRPQFATLAAYLGAAGKEFKIGNK